MNMRGNRMKCKNAIALCVWVLVMQLVLWLLAMASVSLLFLNIDGIVEAVSLLSIGVCFFGGYILSKRMHFERYKSMVVLYIIWLVVPAVLIYFVQYSDMGWLVSLPYRSIAQTLFPSYFKMYQSAWVLDFVQPLLVACSYVAVFLAFGVGMCAARLGKK